MSRRHGITQDVEVVSEHAAETAAAVAQNEAAVRDIIGKFSATWRFVKRAKMTYIGVGAVFASLAWVIASVNSIGSAIERLDATVVTVGEIKTQWKEFREGEWSDLREQKIQPIELSLVRFEEGQKRAAERLEPFREELQGLRTDVDEMRGDYREMKGTLNMILLRLP